MSDEHNGGSVAATAGSQKVHIDNNAIESIEDKTPTSVSTKRKQPPPESPSETRTRTFVILSFWAVIVFLGLPMWWKTTSIYRASLPVEEITEWTEGRACRPEFPLQIAVHIPDVGIPEAKHLIQTTQHALDDFNEVAAHHLRLQLAETKASKRSAQKEIDAVTDAEDVALTVRLLARDGVAIPFSTLHPYSAGIDIFYAPGQIPSTSSSASPLATYIANELHGLFAEEQAIISSILAQNPVTAGPGQASSTSSLSSQSMSTGARDQRKPRNMKSISQELASTIAKSAARSFKYAPTYHLTFSLFTPESSPSAWDIEESLREYIDPVLSAFSSISNFTVDTQVQIFASFAPSAPKPVYDEASHTWLLQKDDLSSFVNAAEWPLSPSIGGGPTINFILYVPSPSQSPLRIAGTESTSWLVPQWGSVFILNPQTPEILDSVQSVPIGHLTIDTLKPAFATFTSHLLSLLGVPSTPATSLPLRLATLTRLHTLRLLHSSSASLGSLSRLTQTLASIPIPLSVSSAVTDTLSHLEATCSSLRAGRFNDALAHARIAETKAEGAFFEKSMVGQVYFPDEHKIAIYLPLLGPIGVPLVMSLIKEIKRWASVLKARKASAKP